MSQRLHIIFILFFILSCAAPTNKRADEIHISLPTEPPTLDWNKATDNVSYQILNQLMEGLTQYDNQLNPIPAAAQSWETRDNGRTYIFHINPNYHWSDGIPVTSEHFRDSWLRLLNPKTASEYAYFLFDIIGAKEFNSGALSDENQVGIGTPDPFTLIVHLKKPVIFFPAITTFMVTFPIRNDLIQKFGDTWTEPQNLVTCGPYQLKEWWHEYRLHLVLNPYYGGSPQPVIKKITIYLVSDPATSLSLYETGELDVVSPPPIALPRYQNHPDLVRQTKLRGYYFGFNTRQKPFDNPLLRKAFALALDKSFLPQILKGGERAVDSWIPPNMFGFNENRGLHFDPKKARQLLEEWHTTHAKIEKITLAFNSDPVNKKIAEWAQDQWKKNLGITVELNNEEWKSYLQHLHENPAPLFRLGWGADYPDPDNFMNLFTSDSGNNYTGFKDKSYDALIAMGSGESDSEKRKNIYDQAQKQLLEDNAVIIPLFIPAQNILVKPSFRPYPLLPLDFVYYKRVKQ